WPARRCATPSQRRGPPKRAPSIVWCSDPVLRTITVGHRAEIQNLLNVGRVAEAGFEVLSRTAGLDEPLVVRRHRVYGDLGPSAGFHIRTETGEELAPVVPVLHLDRALFAINAQA